MDVSELALALALTLTLRVTGIRGPYTIATQRHMHMHRSGQLRDVLQPQQSAADGDGSAGEGAECAVSSLHALHELWNVQHEHAAEVQPWLGLGLGLGPGLGLGLEKTSTLQHAPATRCSTGWNPMHPAVCDARVQLAFMTACSPVRPGCNPMRPSCAQAAPWGHPVCISGAARLLRGVQLVRPDYALASRAVPDHARAAQIGSRESMAKSATHIGA